MFKIPHKHNSHPHERFPEKKKEAELAKFPHSSAVTKNFFSASTKLFQRIFLKNFYLCNDFIKNREFLFLLGNVFHLEAFAGIIFLCGHDDAEIKIPKKRKRKHQLMKIHFSFQILLLSML